VMYGGAIKRELVGAGITERALVSSALNIGGDGGKAEASQAVLP
jgi:ribose transport system ATP-binding protein